MDTVKATELALALIRTRPVGRWPEEVHSWDDAQPLLDQAHLAPGPGDTLDEVRALRNALVIPLLSTSDTQAAVALNALCHAHGLHPWLDVEVEPITAGHRGRDQQLATRLAAALVPALMRARAAGLLQRVGTCQDSDCDTAFLDHSPNTRRRYCSPRCATRTRVAQHRLRRTTQP